MLSGADVTVVNLETALGSGGSPSPRPSPSRCRPRRWSRSGPPASTRSRWPTTTAWTTAPRACRTACASRRRPDSPILGIGADEDAGVRPVDHRGQRPADRGDRGQRHLRLQPRAHAGPRAPARPASPAPRRPTRTACWRRCRATRDQVDTLVVYLHYGTEKQTCPNPRQKDLAELLTGRRCRHRRRRRTPTGCRAWATWATSSWPTACRNFIFKATSAPRARPAAC